MRRQFSGVVVLLCLIGALAFAGDLHAARAISATIVVPDDFPTIQEAVNHAAEGDTILVRGGTYCEHLVVNKTVTLVGESTSTTVVDGNGTGHVIHVVSDNVTVTGFTVQRSGNTHMPALEAGICLNRSAGCLIQGNLLVDNGFCGISLLYSHRNTICNNTVVRSSWDGIHLLTSNYNVIANNTVDSLWGGINGHGGFHYNNVTGNTITNTTHAMFYHDATHNLIHENTITTAAAEGIWLQDQVSYNHVTDNHVANASVAIRVQGPNYNNTVARNTIVGAEYGILIQDYATHTRVTDNTIASSRASSDSWRAGIRLDNAYYTTIDRNTITDNNYGILLYVASPHTTVFQNTLTGNEFGLRVASGGSHYLNMTDNAVTHNRGYGIGLTGFTSGSHYATLTRNLIMNNSDGIALGQYSNAHLIQQNTIRQNGYGFYIDYSTQNTIQQNTILDNTHHVYLANGSVNTWDGDYPAGGNYWSTYTDIDLYKGPHQNVTGCDGVWDHPYSLDADNQDRYPLTKPLSEPAGDVDDDRDVDLFDIVRIAILYGVELPDPQYNRLCDLDLDGDIDRSDIIIAAGSYGNSWQPVPATTNRRLVRATLSGCARASSLINKRIQMRVRANPLGAIAAFLKSSAFPHIADALQDRVRTRFLPFSRVPLRSRWKGGRRSRL
jgi:parallel beta-helix repeat protein